jgi:hypothetical protein
MKQLEFRIICPIVAVGDTDAGERSRMVIPLGAVITLDDETSTVKKMTTVAWKGKTVRIFSVDLAQRAILVG